eukprot:4066305-Prymnesium_polylepis.1
MDVECCHLERYGHLEIPLAHLGRALDCRCTKAVVKANLLRKRNLRLCDVEVAHESKRRIGFDLGSQCRLDRCLDTLGREQL